MTDRSPEDTERRLGRVLAICGLILAVIGIVAGIFVPEVRCSLGIDLCSAKPSATHSTIRAPGSSNSAIIEAPADSNLPYLVDPPASHQPKGKEPYVELSLEQIVNRGKGVVVSVSGSGFTTNSGVRLTWDLPGGSTYLSDIVFADDRGLFSTKLLWLPFQYLGVSGNDGAWKIIFKDASGKAAANQVFVVSDGKTPPPSEWELNDPLNRQPLSSPALSVDYSGTLCGADNLLMESRATGFTPEAGGELSYFRPDGKRIGARGVTFNAAGEMDLVQDWWTTQACSQNHEFRCRVLLVENVSGRKAEAYVDLPTAK